MIEQPMDGLDQQILDEVRDLYDMIDPPPDGLGQRMKFALTVQALQAEVAELTATAVLETRSEQAEQTDSITFTRGEISMLVTFGERRPTTIDLDAWITVPGARVELQIGNDLSEAVADEHGRLAFLAVPRGPANFVIWPSAEAAAPIVTPTITL